MHDADSAAIVVLGAAVLPDGTPSPALARRIALAARLHRGGAAATVIGSGGLGDHPPSEARAIRDALVAAGVPAAAVVEEDRARSTFENAANSIAIMRARGLDRAVIATDAFHLPRALLTFRLMGMPAIGAGARFAAGTPPWTRAAAWLREGAALPVYLVRLAARRLAPRRAGP
jgi:uncharacterized SAM-binding protein YcdF (DUF218 family)